MTTVTKEDKRKSLREFVKNLFKDVKRKYTDEPYFYHLENVARMADDFVKSTAYGYEAGLLHDTLEDIPGYTTGKLMGVLKSCGYVDIEVAVIALLVKGLTDVYTKEAYPDLNRKARKRKEAERLGETELPVQEIKFCDLFDNTSTIVMHDPGFARTYLKEKRDLLIFMHKPKGYLRDLLETTLANSDKLVNNYSYGN